VQNVYDESVGCKMYITEHRIVVWSMYMAEVLGAKSMSLNKLTLKMKNKNKFHLYYHKQNQNSKFTFKNIKNNIE